MDRQEVGRVALEVAGSSERGFVHKLVGIEEIGGDFTVSPARDAELFLHAVILRMI
jgi:hypothetical protein